MSKVDILRLDSVTTNDTKATTTINTNFQNIQSVIETLLSRTGVTPNYMDAVLDMNSYRIINTAMPTEDFDVVNLKYLRDYVGNIESLVADATAAAEAALDKANNAAASATSSAADAQTAQAAAAQAAQDAINAAADADRIQGYLEDPNLIAVGEDLRSSASNIKNVNNHLEAIDTVNDNIDAIQTVRDNLQAIKDAPQAAQQAQQYSSQAGLSANSALTAALRAGEAAQSARNAEDTVKNTEDTVENYARSANTSASRAENAKIEAKSAATSAQNSATSAQTASKLSQNWAIKTNGPVSGNEYSAKYWAQQASVGAVTDNKSINRNSNNELQTIGVIDQNNSSTALKEWSGTTQEYTAIQTKDANTIYNVLEDGVYKGTTKIAAYVSSGGYHPDLLSFQWSDHLLNNVSWLRADTFSWQDGTVYEAAYEHLSADILGKTLQSETISAVTVQFYLADDGHKICPASEESNVASIYTNTGVSWYYILDTTNQRFKLPRTKFGLTGLRDSVGKYVPESLPNIKGTLNNSIFNTSDGDGVFTVTTASSGDGGGYDLNKKKRSLSFSASDSSSSYQDSAPVQQRATQMYLYFYVGNYTQEAIEQTAGLNAELFNSKADIDLSNVTNVGTSKVAGWAMPSDTYVDLTLGADGASYTAPANGYFCFYRIQNGKVGYTKLTNSTTGFVSETRNTIDKAGNGAWIMARKNDVVTLNYDGATTLRQWRFYYAQGSESEAN